MQFNEFENHFLDELYHRAKFGEDYDLPQTLHGDTARRGHQQRVIHFSTQRIVFPTACTEKFGQTTRAGCRYENMVFVCFFSVTLRGGRAVRSRVTYFKQVLCRSLWVDFDTVYIVFFSIAAAVVRGRKCRCAPIHFFAARRYIPQTAIINFV